MPEIPVGSRVRLLSPDSPWRGKTGVMIDYDPTDRPIFCTIQLDDTHYTLHPRIDHVEPLSGVELLGEIAAEEA